MLHQAEIPLLGKLCYEKLAARGNPSRLRANSFTVDVRYDHDGDILVRYLVGDQLEAVKTKTVVFACPKFIVGPNLGGHRRLNDVEQIQNCDITPYLVANVMLNKSIEKEFYDLYLLGGERRQS